MKRILVVVTVFLITHHPAFGQQPQLVVQQGHTSWIEKMSFSADGALLYSKGLSDKALKTWEVSTGRLLRTESATTPMNRSSINGSVKLQHSYYFPDMVSGPRGRLSAFPYADRVVIHFGGGKDSLMIPARYPQDYAFSNDDQLVAFYTWVENKATKTSSEKTFVIDAERKMIVAEFDGGTCLAISPDKRYIVNFQRKTVGKYESYNPTLSIWNIPERRIERVIDLPRHELIDCVNWSPDGTLIAAGSSFSSSGIGTIGMYEAATGRELYNIRNEKEYARTFTIDGSNRMIAASINDTSIKVWNMTEAKQLFTLSAQNSMVGKPLYSLLFSPDGSLLVREREMTAKDFEDPLYGCKVEKSWLYETATGKNLCELKNTDFPFSFNADGSLLAGRGGIKSVNIWDIRKKAVISTLTTSLPDIYCTKKTVSNAMFDIDLSPSGKICAANFGSETFWNVAAKKEFSAIKDPGSYQIHYLNGEKYIAAVKNYIYQTNALVVDITSGAVVSQYQRRGRELSTMQSAVSPDGKYLIAVADSIVILSLPDLKLVSVLECPVNAGEIQAVGFSHNSGVCAAVGIDGPIRFWNTLTGKVIAALYFFSGKDWAIVASDGRFDGTTAGFNRLHFVQGDHALPLESFFERFFTPNLLAQILEGKNQAGHLKPALDLSRSIKLPPRIAVKSPRAGDSFTTDQLTIDVEATDQGGGIDEVRLYQNGKLVSEEQRGMKKVEAAGETIARHYPVTLLPGANTFRVTAFNADRTESVPCEFTVLLKSAEASSNLYILSIGINDYKNGKYNLNYGRPDAQAFAAAAGGRGKTIFKNIYTTELYDANATRQSIESAFQKIASASAPSDAFVFYYAGHGVMSEGSPAMPSDFYLIPHDVTKLYGDDELLKEKGISAKELKTWCTGIKGQKQLIVLDACQSGGAVETFASRGAAEEKAILQLARSAGVVVLAATGTEQFATEFSQLGHGVFTYAILRALEGGADGSPKDGKITVKELESYIDDQVPELTKKYRGTSQYPNSYARGQDFPVGIVQ